MGPRLIVFVTGSMSVTPVTARCFLGYTFKIFIVKLRVLMKFFAHWIIMVTELEVFISFAVLNKSQKNADLKKWLFNIGLGCFFINVRFCRNAIT